MAATYRDRGAATLAGNADSATNEGRLRVGLTRSTHDRRTAGFGEGVIEHELNDRRLFTFSSRFARPRRRQYLMIYDPTFGELPIIDYGVGLGADGRPAGDCPDPIRWGGWHHTLAAAFHRPTSRFARMVLGGRLFVHIV